MGHVAGGVPSWRGGGQGVGGGGGNYSQPAEDSLNILHGAGRVYPDISSGLQKTMKIRNGEVCPVRTVEDLPAALKNVEIIRSE